MKAQNEKDRLLRNILLDVLLEIKREIDYFKSGGVPHTASDSHQGESDASHSIMGMHALVRAE